MAWIGSTCDEELARKAAGSALLGQNAPYSIAASSLSSVAVAQAATDALYSPAVTSVCDQWAIRQIRRGYKIASNMGGTFSSSYTTFYASLPSSALHPRAMISS